MINRCLLQPKRNITVWGPETKPAALKTWRHVSGPGVSMWPVGKRLCTQIILVSRIHSMLNLVMGIVLMKKNKEYRWPHQLFSSRQTLVKIIIHIVIAMVSQHCQPIVMNEKKMSQPLSLPLYYFLRLFRHKPINSGLSLQPLINPFRTKIMLNTGDWGQAWNYPPRSVVMTKCKSSAWSVCLCVFVPPHTHLVFLCLPLVPLDYHSPFVKATRMHCLPSLISMCMKDMRSALHAHTHAHTPRVVCHTLCGICNVLLLPLEAFRPHRGPLLFLFLQRPATHTHKHIHTGSDVVINLCQTWSGRVC